MSVGTYGNVVWKCTVTSPGDWKTKCKSLFLCSCRNVCVFSAAVANVPLLLLQYVW